MGFADGLTGLSDGLTGLMVDFVGVAVATHLLSVKLKAARY
jgi:hypothetical protein